jgi:hypothetical protein
LQQSGVLKSNEYAAGSKGCMNVGKQSGALSIVKIGERQAGNHAVDAVQGLFGQYLA